MKAGDEEKGTLTSGIDIEIAPTLLERARLGILLVACALCAFLLFDLVFTHKRFAVLLSLSLVRLALCIAAYMYLLREPSHRRVTAVALAVVALTVASSSVMSSLRGEYESNALLCVAMAMGAAALLPWGVRAQAAAVGFCAVALLHNIWFVGADPLVWLAHPSAVMAVSAFAVSLYIAHDVERFRLQTARHNAQARESAALLKADQDLIAALHRAELLYLSDAGRSEVFGALLEILLELTGSRYGFVGEVYFVQAGFSASEAKHPRIRAYAARRTGGTSGSSSASSAEGIELEGIERVFGELLDKHVPVFVDHVPDSLLPSGHVGLGPVLGLPLKVGEELLGMIAIAGRPGGYDRSIIEYLRPLISTCAYLSNAYRQEAARSRAEDQVRLASAELEHRVRERTVELERANAELRLANRELEAFSYMVSHDLRGPLRAISGFSQVMLEEYESSLDDNAKNYLERIREGGLRLGRLIDDLLTLGRVTRAPLKRCRVDMSETACLLLDQLRVGCPQREVEKIVEAGLFAYADPDLLHELLKNLLDNAWKFSEPRPKTRIEFGSFASEEGTVYFVRDNGVGFDPAYQAKLFQPFERIHEPGRFAGTGMGLAIVERIALRHGGRAWAESSEEGATFFFTLGQGASTDRD